MARRKNTNNVNENENIIASAVVNAVLEAKQEKENEKMENVAVENVEVKENENVFEKAMENAVNNENVAVENEVVPAETVETVETVEEIEENAGETKERKERAKINTTPFPVGEIVRDRLTCLLPAVIDSMQGVENAEELSKAKLFSIGHDIVIDLVNALQEKFEEYAPRSYKGKNPSNHWLLWENTRNASLEIKAELENDLMKLYSVVDEKVYELLNVEDYAVLHNAKYTIQNNVDCYVMLWENNLTAQLDAITKTGIVKIYVPEEFTVRKFNKELAKYGFTDTDDLNIDERKYPGINKTFKAIRNLVVYEKQE